MAFKLQVLDILLLQQAFSGLDPILRAQLNIVAADRAAYFLLEELPRDVRDSILEHLFC